MTRIKFCGMVREQDVDAAAMLGVDAVGFVFWEGSPRRVAVAAAARLVRRLPAAVVPVGVFVRPTRDEIARAMDDAGIRVAQVHDARAPLEPPPCDLWIAAALDQQPLHAWPAAALVLDAHDPERHGGTGRTIDWDRAAAVAAARRVWLAGGLTPANVTAAIARVRPYGVDVASGIEDAPGVKNADVMRAFVAAVRDAQS